MKSENILRAARNSLLCFFMALGAGFLVACGGGGGGSVVSGDPTPFAPAPAPAPVPAPAPQEFPVYLSDSAAEGVEYSGPTGSGLTGKGGVFSASEGVFEFSIGDTPLGRVRLNGDWRDSHVTPADFIDVNEQKVIDIARVMQGLDEHPQSVGISISQRARTDVRGNLLLTLTTDERIDIFSAAYRFPSREYTIPTKNVARDHFVATRKCLFSGVYDGNYRTTASSNRERLDDEGQIYYAVEPFADRTTGVKFSNVYPAINDNRGITTTLSGPADVGVIGSTITLRLPGNELSFVTPRVVAGIWQEVNQEGITVSGTSSLTLAEGNPRATRRIVGVEKVNGGERVLGLYALDYFGNEGLPSGVFRGRYYDVTANENFALLLTIAGGAFWPTGATPTTLTLIGTRDDGDNKVATAITLSVTRNVNVNGNYRVSDNRGDDDNDGSFGGTGIGVSGAPGVISGTWCDISGAVGTASPVPLPMTPPAPRVIRIIPIQIDIAWKKVRGARSYKLYRSRILNGVYDPVGAEPYDEQIGGGLDLGYRDRDGPFLGVEFFYRLAACNSSGCSPLSPAVSSDPAN